MSGLDEVKYIDYYNNVRHHQGIDNRIPADLCPKEILRVC